MRCVNIVIFAIWLMTPLVIAAQQVVDQTQDSSHDEASAGQRHVTQLAPDIPRVTCEHGSMFISADRSTLLSVLAAIRSCAGIVMDIPNNLPNDRSFIRLGPGPQREVMERLLATIPIDFAIQEVPGGAEKRLRVLFFERSLEGGIPLAVSSSDPHLTRNTPGSARAAFLLSHEGHPSDLITISGEESPNMENNSGLEQKPTGTVGEPFARNTSDEVTEGTKPAIGTLETTQTSMGAADQPGAPAPDLNSPAAAPDDPIAMELQNKIKAMQQMFEQRKRLGTSAPIDSPR